MPIVRAPQTERAFAVHYDTLLELFGQGRSILLRRCFVDLTGSLSAAVLLSQAFYWQQRTTDPDGWFYKTRDEWYKEIGIRRYEQEQARKTLRATTFWQEKKKGIPPTTHYRIDIERLVEAINNLPSNGTPSATQTADPLPFERHTFCQTYNVSSEITSQITPERYIVESEKTPDSTPPLNGNGKPPKGEPKTFQYLPGFQRFWDRWPPSHRKVSKRTCAAVWVRQHLEPRTDEIIATMTAWAETEQWQSGFDPSPLTWLRQCRYDDGLPEVIQNHKPTQRLPWHEHADHRVRRFTNGPYCETCARVLMSHEVPPKKE